MPRPIQRGTEALALAKHYNLKGKVPLVLDEVIVPVHLVGDLTGTDAEQPAGGVFTANAGVGNTPIVGVENPLDSRVIIRIDRYELTGAGASSGCSVWVERSVGGVFPSGAPATSSLAEWRDSGITGVATGRLIQNQTTPPPPFSGPYWRLLTPTAGNSLDWRHAPTFWITPGNRFWLEGHTVNAQAIGAFAWVELPTEPSDL